jgi:hypothetical protein
MTNQNLPRALPTHYGLVLGAASVVSALLLLSSLPANYLNAYSSPLTVHVLTLLGPWLRGLAMLGILPWAAMHALQVRRLVPLGLVATALFLVHWFPWWNLYVFSFTLHAAAVAVVLGYVGYLTYSPLRHCCTFLQYSGLLVGSVLGVASVACTVGYVGSPGEPAEAARGRSQLGR